MRHTEIQLAVIDMAGTTVADDGLVVSAFEAAASAAGLPDSGAERDRARQYVLDTMGQSKISVFRALFGTEELAQQAPAFCDFARPGAVEVVDELLGRDPLLLECLQAGARIGVELVLGHAPTDVALAFVHAHRFRLVARRARAGRP